MKTIRLTTLLAIAIFTSLDLAYAQTEDLRKAKARIGEILKDRVDIYDKRTKLEDTPKDIVVQDDKIEFKIKKQNTIFYFSDLIDDTIVFVAPKYKVVLELKNFDFITNILGKNNYYRFEELQRNLILIQRQLEENRYSTQLTLFEPIAMQYRALKLKPAVSEAQREYIVQANSFNRQNNYPKAIELYNKAIESDQTAYPAAYSNLALLSANINKFDAAIYYMKKYLLLEPEAADARSAQDKIYEWKAQIAQ